MFVVYRRRLDLVASCAVGGVGSAVMVVWFVHFVLCWFRFVFGFVCGVGCYVYACVACLCCHYYACCFLCWASFVVWVLCCRLVCCRFCW